MSEPSRNPFFIRSMIQSVMLFVVWQQKRSRNPFFIRSMIQSAAHRFATMAKGYDPECANPVFADDVHHFPPPFRWHWCLDNLLKFHNNL